MKPSSAIVRPSAADHSLLPAALAVSGVLIAVAQLAFPIRDRMPVESGMLVAPAVPERVVGRVVTDPVLLVDPLFTRSRGTVAKDVATGGPLGGAVPVGITRTRGGTRVVLQGEDGRPVSLAIGQNYNGWRVAGVATDAVRFTRDGKTITLALSSGRAGDREDDKSQVADER